MTPLARLGFGLAMLVLALDQASKAWVLGGLGFSPPGCLEAGVGCGRIELSPIFDLTMVWNRGVSFGLLAADSLWGRVLLVAFALGISVALSVWLWRTARRLTALALGLVIGGAIGNLIDRVRFGAVADFFDFSDIWFFYVFNVADAAISVGVAVLLLDMVLEGREQKRAAKAAG